MAKQRVWFECQSCGAQAPKWLGRCPECGGWGTLEKAAGGREGPPPGGGVEAPRPLGLEEITLDEGARLLAGIGEWDRVLGGGLVAGSLLLLGGDPGVGKSTLLMWIIDKLSSAHPALYVSGEESLLQVKMRAERLGLGAKGFRLLAQTDADAIIAAARNLKPSLLVVDSIQTTVVPALGAHSGSLAQLREAAGRFLVFAKESGIPILLVGHVTKEGALAGPRVLEHMVDVVLYLQAEGAQAFRFLRAEKNRFGSTQELGVFEMKADGLVEVKNPSSLFLAGRPLGQSGSVVTCTLHGSRPLLLEVQALVVSTHYGTGRRTTSGIDSNRIALLSAVVEKHLGLVLSGCDVFVNVAGGMSLQETGCDLALCAAMVSSYENRPMDTGCLVLGEVGLSGEVRAVSRLEVRLAEAQKLGFERALVPSANLPHISKALKTGLDISGISKLNALTEALRARA
ncbi:MAG: DNA repair protein RadA [Proteobacteria bacterium]|nr:DNA repair protein RadA [Cystobacterineae bacterium]MCL2259444.1 DNA repair protein RadA [Cystobacterineae bacterium]MCL2314214.1 DNA repair protein RadA [Pseudomonadota bacterium]